MLPNAKAVSRWVRAGRAACSVLGLVFVFSASFAGGYEFEVVYSGDVLTNSSGGIETGTRYLDNLDLNIEIDVAQAAGMGSGTLFVHGLYNNGGTFSDELVGDLQIVSNIEAEEAWRIFELWYELGGETWSFRTGLYDLNSEFDVNEAGSIFLHSSHGTGADLGQTGENGPSIFPVSSLALRGEVQIEASTVRVAVLDAVPGNPDDAASNTIDLSSTDGYLTIAELDVPITESVRLWTGYWRYSGEFERLSDAGFSAGNVGWYVGAERRFRIGSRSAAWFLRYGQAEEQLNKLKDYTGFGFVTDGLIAARPADQFGMAVASAMAGAPYRDSLKQAGVGVERRETAWELTYRAQINQHFFLQPDIQYVQNPSFSAELDNALIIGLRIELIY
jgi:porin